MPVSRNEWIIKALRDRGFTFLYTQEGVAVNCFFCQKRFPEKSPDSGFHLGINFEKGVYHCFRCHERGKVSALAVYLRYRLMRDEVEYFSCQKRRQKDKGKLIAHIKECSVPVSRASEVIYSILKKRAKNHQWLRDFVDFVCAEDFQFKSLFRFYKKEHPLFGPRLYLFRGDEFAHGRRIDEVKSPKFISIKKNAESKKFLLFERSTDDLFVVEGFFDSLFLLFLQPNVSVVASCGSFQESVKEEFSRFRNKYWFPDFEVPILSYEFIDGFSVMPSFLYPEEKDLFDYYLKNGLGKTLEIFSNLKSKILSHSDELEFKSQVLASL